MLFEIQNRKLGRCECLRIFIVNDLKFKPKIKTSGTGLVLMAGREWGTLEFRRSLSMDKESVLWSLVTQVLYPAPLACVIRFWGHTTSLV